MSDSETVRVAAVGDIHVRDTDTGAFRDLFAAIDAQADVLLLCGDITHRGQEKEAVVLAEELAVLRIPVLAVLGNHDYQAGEVEGVKEAVCRAGVHLLEGEPFEHRGVGFAGTKGFAGGFGQHMLEPFGEALIKDFVYEAVRESIQLETSLASLGTERKVGVLHYAPIPETIAGEPVEIFPYLGSSRLAEPLCRFTVQAAFHGHAHHGTPEGVVNGIPIYNVSYPLMRTVCPDHPFRLIEV